MATFTVHTAKSYTLTISQVDTITFDTPGDRLIVSARGAATDFVAFTYAGPGGVPATPTALGNDCFVVTGGRDLVIPIDGSAMIGVVSLISAQAAPVSVMTTG